MSSSIPLLRRRQMQGAPAPAVPDIPKIESLAEREIERRRREGVKAEFEALEMRLATEEKELDVSLLALAGKKDAAGEVAQIRARLADVQLERRGLLEIHIPRADAALEKVTGEIQSLEAAAAIEAGRRLLAERLDEMQREVVTLEAEGESIIARQRRIRILAQEIPVLKQFGQVSASTDLLSRSILVLRKISAS